MEPISKCEEEVLLVIFKLGAKNASLQPIRSNVNMKYRHNWCPQTVSTFLVRLVKKNILMMERRGRTCYYTPVMTLEEYQRQRIKEQFVVLFDGDKEVFKKCLEMLELAEEYRGERNDNSRTD